MNAKQISTMTGRLVEHQSEFRGLSTKNAQWVIQNPKDAVALFVEAVQKRELTTSILLKFLNTVKIPATTEKFVAKDHCVVDTSDSAPVKISYLGNNFEEWFSGKIEEPIGETILRCQELRKNSTDDSIINKLGGEARAETTLAEMSALMERQPNGKKGTLLISGYANIFYIRDINGVLRAVDCDWFGDGWYVCAYSVDAPNGWGDGDQVFSRNPSKSKD